MKFSLNLQTQLSLIFAISTLLFVIIFGSLYGFRSIKQVKMEIGDSLSEAAYAMENNLSQYMWSRYGETTVLSSLLDTEKIEDIQSIEPLFNQMQSTFPAFSWIGLTDQTGTVIASTNSILKGEDISARPVFAEATEKPFIGDVHEALLLGKLLPNPTGEEMKFVDISTPIYDSNDNFIGVLATHLSWEWVKEIEASMLDSAKRQDNLEYFIVSKNDNVVILGPDEMIGKELDLQSINLALTKKNGWTTETWADGKEYVTGYMLEDGYKDYPGLQWIILARQPVEVAFMPIKNLITFFLVSGFVFVLLFAVLGWYLADRIASPLKTLAVLADRLRMGEFVHIPIFRGISELEVLSGSLRNLVSSLTKTESALFEMKEIANRDELTGLANRYALDLYLKAFSETHSEAAVLFIDLDGFKRINDTYGHHKGDELLVQVSSRLKSIINDEEMIARVGGDEFIGILPIKKGEAIAKEIISSLNTPFLIDGQHCSISCSVGIALWKSSGRITIEDTLKAADKALYEAKNNGKNQFILY